MRRHGRRRAPPAEPASAAHPPETTPRAHPAPGAGPPTTCRSPRSLPATRQASAPASSALHRPSGAPPPRPSTPQADATARRPPPRRARIDATHAVCLVLRHSPPRAGRNPIRSRQPLGRADPLDPRNDAPTTPTRARLPDPGRNRRPPRPTRPVTTRRRAVTPARERSHRAPTP
jgi:hypothetical protein